MKLWVLLLAFLCAAPGVLAQAKPGSAIRALTVGDTVPDIVFTNIINYHSKTARLSDFKGKLVILDFWATWCAPCIEALPKMNALQQKFADQIQIIAITTEKSERVKSFFQKYKSATDISSLLILSDDSTLSQTFPYKSVPHEIWIGSDNIVKAITNEEYVTADNVKDLLNNIGIIWEVKNEDDKFPFKDTPMFSLSTSIEKYPVSTRFYSGFTNYFKGVSPGLFIDRDSISNIVRYNQYNMSILSLYSIAYGKFPTFQNPKTCVLNVADSSKFIYDTHRIYYDLWKKKNWYCYESVSPLWYTDEELNTRLIHDLDFFFRVNSKKELKKIPCLILRQIDKSNSALYTNNELPKHELSVTKGGIYLYTQINSRLFELVHTLNNDTWLKDLPLVIDETKYNLPVDLNIKIGSDPSDVNLLRKALVKYGLDLISEEREIEMLILSEK